MAISPDEEIVIQFIRHYNGLSKEDLVKFTNFSRSKINRILQSLSSKNIVVETSKSQNTGGRRAMIFNMNGKLGLVAGVYLGATSLDLVLSDMSGKSIGRFSEEAFVKDGPIVILDRICELLSQMLAANGFSN